MAIDYERLRKRLGLPPTKYGQMNTPINKTQGLTNKAMNIQFWSNWSQEPPNNEFDFIEIGISHQEGPIICKLGLMGVGVVAVFNV